MSLVSIASVGLVMPIKYKWHFDLLPLTFYLKNFRIFFLQVGAVEELVNGGRVRNVEALLADALVTPTTKSETGNRLALK